MNALIKIIVLFIPCNVVLGISINGTECKTSRDCNPHEICDKGSCQCAQDYIHYIHKCVQVKRHGEECSYDIQCNDSKMVCTNEDHDVQQPRYCVCDIYHLWSHELQDCIEITNLTRIGGSFREAYNVTGIIEKSAQKVFFGVVIAGLVFVSILLSFLGICSLYGCCTKNKKGRYGEGDEGKSQINEVAVIGSATGTYGEIDTDFSDMAAF